MNRAFYTKQDYLFRIDTTLIAKFLPTSRFWSVMWSKLKIVIVQKFNLRIRDMIDNCNINWTSPRIRSLLFFIRALFAELCYPNLQSFVWRRHVGAHLYGHQHGGRKPTETSVTEFCYKSVNLSLDRETQKLYSTICFKTRTVQIAKFPEIHLNPAISNSPGERKIVRNSGSSK